MIYVLDSCVAFKWEVTEPLSDKARKLRDEAHNGIHILLAPDVLPTELGHAMIRAERQGRVSALHGWAFWQAIMLDCPQLAPSLPLMPRAYEISSTLKVGVYDCLYVALAERSGCEFVTSDDKLIRSLQPYFPFIISLAALP